MGKKITEGQNPAAWGKKNYRAPPQNFCRFALPSQKFAVPLRRKPNQKHEMENFLPFDDLTPREDLSATPTAARVHPGDLWRLGDHLLYCGDSLDRASLSALMGDDRAALVFTDPPYGMGKEADGVSNDNQSLADLVEFNGRWIPLAFDYMTPAGSFYCWGLDLPLWATFWRVLWPMMEASQGSGKIYFKNYIIWDKGEGGFGCRVAAGRSYFRNDERCLFLTRGVELDGQNCSQFFEGFEPLRAKFDAWARIVGKPQVERLTCTTCGHWWSRSQWEMPARKHFDTLAAYCREHNLDAWNDPAVYDAYERIVGGPEWVGHVDAFRRSRAYFDNAWEISTAVWHFPPLVSGNPERATAGGHATPKPVKLCERAIKTSSRAGDIVLDLFGGSGSTLIACEHTGRRARVIELEPRWCDTILTRWENYTLKKATKIN